MCGGLYTRTIDVRCERVCAIFTLRAANRRKLVTARALLNNLLVSNEAVRTKSAETQDSKPEPRSDSMRVRAAEARSAAWKRELYENVPCTD